MFVMPFMARLGVTDSGVVGVLLERVFQIQVFGVLKELL
jgi:hypothetical protein